MNQTLIIILPLPPGLRPLCDNLLVRSTVALSTSSPYAGSAPHGLIYCVVRRVTVSNSLMLNVEHHRFPEGFSIGIPHPNSLLCTGHRLNLVLRIVLHRDRLPIAPASSFSSVVNEGFTLSPAGGCLVFLQWPYCY